MNSTANSASASITKKIACTTRRSPGAEFARRARTLHAAITPARAMSTANTGALITPTQKVVGEIASMTRFAY